MKKFQLLILSLLLAMPLGAATTRGDVDGDGKVGIDDVTAMIDLLLSGGEAPAAADVDGDGKVNIDDVTALLDTLLTGSETPAAEGDWVDLGLPSGTIWATRNVGAERPEDYGDYFAWGETEPKSSYDWSTYKWYKSDNNANGYTKYCTKSSYGYNGFVDNKTELDPEDDAACAHYPGGRTPSLEQIEELVEYCTRQWVQQNGVNGTLVTGPNGNTMFLPATGGRWDDELNHAGSDGYCWSRTLNSGYPYGAYYLNFYSGGWYWHYYYLRVNGFTVRAVRVS